MSKYRLVNPIIGGKFNSVFDGKSHIDAAEDAWHSISKQVESNVPQFAFTLEREGDNKLFHYMVKELMSNNESGSKVNYSLNEINVKLNDSQLRTFRDHVRTNQARLEHDDDQSGGASKRRPNYRFDDSSSSDSDSSSSSSSDSEADMLRSLKVKNAAKNMLQIQPFYWYTPVIYGFDTVYVPQLVQYSMPYIEINLSSAFIN
jgi:hypothetical protein